jgi:hypothetical protein
MRPNLTEDSKVGCFEGSRLLVLIKQGDEARFLDEQKAIQSLHPWFSLQLLQSRALRDCISDIERVVKVDEYPIWK